MTTEERILEAFKRAVKLVKANTIVFGAKTKTDMRIAVYSTAGHILRLEDKA